MAISSKTAAVVFMLLLSTTCFVQLPVPARARKLEARAPISSTHHHYPCTGRSVLQVPAANKETDSTTSPGHSPSGGHGSPPGF
ncbi:hypothetical protein PAHAL_3G296600 [Panicum hallii]|uniref:Uncharacterized protein n=1 Tax=Panicum hallii TaxID=206008 RepID=A0A2S3HCD8_9POAL|nr:hypothetical protein PAHAL_3G296600 [Panicum hallii]